MVRLFSCLLLNTHMHTHKSKSLIITNCYPKSKIQQLRKPGIEDNKVFWMGNK